MTHYNEMFKFSLEEVDLIEHAVTQQITYSPSIYQIGMDEANPDKHKKNLALKGVLATLYNQKIWHRQKQDNGVSDVLTKQLISFDCWF